MTQFQLIVCSPSSNGFTKTSRDDAGTPWPTNWVVHKTLDAGPAAGTMGPLRNWPGIAPSAPSRQPIPDCLLGVERATAIYVKLKVVIY